MTNKNHKKHRIAVLEAALAFERANIRTEVNLSPKIPKTKPDLIVHIGRPMPLRVR